MYPDGAGKARAGRRRRWPFLVVGLILGSALTVWLQGLAWPGAPAADDELVQQPTPVIVQAMRSLARLESATFYMQKTIDLKHRERSLFGLVESDDAIVLVAVGEVIAGVDLGALSDDDLEIDRERGLVTMRLAPARILTSRIDNERTYVRERETDLLAGRHEELEAEARERAERALRQAALEAGILSRAQRSATRTLSEIVRALGYEKVEIRWHRE